MSKCYSIDGEDYSMVDIGDVLDMIHIDGMLEVGSVYYEADAIPMVVDDVINNSNIEYFLENLTESVCDEFGECTYNICTDVSEIAKNELELFMKD